MNGWAFFAEEASLVLVENKNSSLFLDEEEHIATYESVWGELSCLAYESAEAWTPLHALAKTLRG